MEETTERVELGPEDSAGGSRFDGLLVAGTYQVGERLGTGGMADVYEAEHVRLGSRVAIKFLRVDRQSDARAVERFRREARRTVAANSENLVSVFDYDELPDGTPYLVMERLFGEDLRSLLERERRLSSRRAVSLAIDACRGLSVVHAAKIVHRDLKPANLFVVKRPNGSELCKILDFGIAKLVNSEATHGGALLGTVRYMAPEQLEDAASVQAAADLYALGAILYECLAGVPAHDGSTLHELMFDILHHDPRPLRDFGTLPIELERVVMRALSRDPTQRHANADDLSRALAPFGPLAPSSVRIEDSHDVTLSDAQESAVQPRRAAPARARVRLALAGSAVAFVAGFATSMGLRETEPARAEVQAVSNPTLAEKVQVTPPSIASAVALPSATTGTPAASAPPLSSAMASAERRPPRRAAPAASSVASGPKPLSERIESNDPYAE